MRNYLVILLASIGLILPSAALADDKSWDVLIINAGIVDGTGSPWFRGAVAISGDKIAWVGSGAPDLTRAREVVDAHDKIVSSGFIDFMGQSSLVYLTNPRWALSRLTQGITVHVSGEGDSAAPQNDVTQPEPVMIDGKSYRWRTYAEYFKTLESHGLPLNLVHNVGASQVRKVVMGETDRTPTQAEMEAMKRLVDEAMRDGAAGLSIALIYEDIAASILTTVIGHNPRSDRLLIDAGGLALSKDLSADHFNGKIGYGLVCLEDSLVPVEGVHVATVHQEHGFIAIDRDRAGDFAPKIGTRLRIIPNHARMTVAPYDRYHVVGAGSDAVIAVWSKASDW